MHDLREQLLRMSKTLIRIDEIYYHAAKALGVTENMLALIYALNDGKTHTQKEISQEWMIPKTTINTLVQECVAAGYVRLMPQVREKEIRLTRLGKTYAEMLLEPLYAAEQAALEAAPPELCQELETYAQQLQAEFDRQMTEGEDHENTH